jgi:hypothetical protein
VSSYLLQQKHRPIGGNTLYETGFIKLETAVSLKDAVVVN